MSCGATSKCKKTFCPRTKLKTASDAVNFQLDELKRRFFFWPLIFFSGKAVRIKVRVGEQDSDFANKFAYDEASITVVFSNQELCKNNDKWKEVINEFIINTLFLYIFLIACNRLSRFSITRSTSTNTVEPP